MRNLNLTTTALLATAELDQLAQAVRHLLLHRRPPADATQHLDAVLDAVNVARLHADQAVQHLAAALRHGVPAELDAALAVDLPIVAVPAVVAAAPPIYPPPEPPVATAPRTSLTPPWIACRKYKGPRSKCSGEVQVLGCEQCDWTVTLCAHHCKRPGMVIRAHVRRVHEGRSVVDNLAKWRAQLAGTSAPPVAAAAGAAAGPDAPRSNPQPARFRCKVQNGDEQPCGAQVSTDEFATHLFREHGKECQPRQARLYFTDERIEPD